MSLGISNERFLPQRRLGLLRNSYPDHVIGSSGNWHDARQCCSAFARTLTTAHEPGVRHSRRNLSARNRSEEKALLACKEKLDKLRRIRNDNALITKFDREVNQIPASSPTVTHQTAHPDYRLPIKPATAPPLARTFPGYGTLAFKVYEDDAAVPLLEEKRLLGRPRSLPGRQFSFRTDDMGSSEFVTCRPGSKGRCNQISTETQNQLFSCERRPWRFAEKTNNPKNGHTRKRIQSDPLPVNKTPPRPYRSGSAPALSHAGSETSPRFQDFADSIQRAKSPASLRSKLQSESRTAPRRGAAHLRSDRPRTPPSVATRVSLSRGKGWMPFEEGPLGVVGEHFAPCKTRPATAKQNNRTIVTETGALKPQNPLVREVTVVPSEGYQGTQTSQSDNQNFQSPPSNICTCKSVRFSCSENTVYEYKSNEPISL